MDFFQNYVRFLKEVRLKISAQVQQVAYHNHPLKTTAAFWGGSVLFLLLLFIIGASLTSHRSRNSTPRAKEVLPKSFDLTVKPTSRRPQTWLRRERVR